MKTCGRLYAVLSRAGKWGTILLTSVVCLGCFFSRGWSATSSPLQESAAGPGITLYAAGDIADCRKSLPEKSGAARTAVLVEKMLASDADAVVLTLGDLTYPRGLLAEFEGCYEPTWGRFKHRTFPSPGNHEYYTPGAAGYYQYFGETAGPLRRGYYSFNLGTWHIVSLNSNLKAERYAEQLEWLANDLAQHPSRCTLAYWHHPYFSSGGHGNHPFMSQVWRTLESAGAEVVLSGHDHDYERFAPQNAEGIKNEQHGMRQFVVGTGGAHLTRFVFRKPNSEAASNSVYGVLRMVLKENSYEWEFVSIDGAVLDKDAALCH
ncbi:MAG: alkaline phosphatase [Paucimonas sp.]|nr:alkaline phosphatase [Paucimonas sp.]